MSTTGVLARPAPPATLLDGASLFLDFDGTLVDLQDRPDAVEVGVRLRALVARLVTRLEGRFALISGRDASFLRQRFDMPTLGVAGSHGLEIHMPDGRALSPGRPAALDKILAELRSFAGTRPGVLVEDKSLGSVLHYRQAPGMEAESHALARALAERHGLAIQTGKMMVEVRAPGADKGTAIATLMREPSMQGTRPVFIGDDDTDEPAFVAAQALDGEGILVGAERPTAARWRLAGVEQTLAWLEAACPA